MPNTSFDFSYTDESSQTTYEPWTNGYAVGFRCTRGGQTEYIYLNPSASEGEPDVFLYQGPDGDPANDPPQHWYAPFNGHREAQ